MLEFETAYVSTGGNKHPSAADWDVRSGVFAFGADCNVALWSPSAIESPGVRELLRGHENTVNAVKFFPQTCNGLPILLSGSVDQSIRIWSLDVPKHVLSRQVGLIEGHTGAINCLAVCEGSSLVISGASDTTIRVWRLAIEQDAVTATLLQCVHLTPKYLPLALATHVLEPHADIILAVAGTRNSVQIFLAPNDGSFSVQATLTGHEGWIRSLAFQSQSQSSPNLRNGLLLASASQDKYVRLWRIAELAPKTSSEQGGLPSQFEQMLSNKMHKLHGANVSYIFTFEALLLGHDDWVYSVSWFSQNGKPRLLSASEDSSLAIWEQEASSSVWLPNTRLGEISQMKGSTTATGSAGGFWNGMWGPTGEEVVVLGRTGSWRLWRYHSHEQRWWQSVGISGHCKSVKDIAWSESGSTLLSTGSDQTTRLHAEWLKDSQDSWHEMGRPQIHGYDLNCIDFLNERQFVSGADEKLLRVFDEPQSTARLLEDLSGIHTSDSETLPDSADIPVLGLSNKAVEPDEREESGAEATTETSVQDEKTASRILNEPPNEDRLGRHTLWPEKEKLYGHGHEISAVATTHDGTLIATSCKASSQEHALIRLYTTHDWREVKPPLMAHSLTVTALRFSADDALLLSVGRDRQWVLWQRQDQGSPIYTLLRADPKGHSRMILNACWALPEAGTLFVTAGRDKSAKIWSHLPETTQCKATISAQSSVTAVDIAPSTHSKCFLLAMGTEAGVIEVIFVDLETCSISQRFELDEHFRPLKSITQLAWRPRREYVEDERVESTDFSAVSTKIPPPRPETMQLAVSSEDSSLTIFNVLFNEDA